MTSIKEKIQSFASLKKGWYFGDGGPIPSWTIDSCLQIVDFLISRGITPDHAFPGHDLSIELISSNENILVEADGGFILSIESKSLYEYYTSIESLYYALEAKE